MKSAYIASERTHYPIGFMCRVLDVSTSGFFAWQARQRAPRRDLDAPLREAIVRVHQESRRRYGCRRVTAWTSDITYLATREGGLSLAVIIALKTRRVLGYSLPGS